MTHLFYRRSGATEQESLPLQPNRDYRWSFWRPSMTSVMPSGFSGPVFIAWWLMHWTRLFANRDYCQFVVYCDRELVHRSGIFPRYLRFPFMGPRDLQVGDTWTAPEHRSRGLASIALRLIVSQLRAPGRAFWYLTTSDNAPSIRAAEGAGFNLAGIGERRSRFGIRFLGEFTMTQCPGEEPSAS